MIRFDCIVGNPPFDSITRNKIITTSFAVSKDVVAMVTPATWSSISQRNTKVTQLIIDSGLVVYKYLGDDAFKGVQLTTTYFISSKATTSTTTKLITYSDVETIVQRDSILYFPGYSDSISGLMAKIKSFANLNNIAVHTGYITRTVAHRYETTSPDDYVCCVLGAGRISKPLDMLKIESTVVQNGKTYQSNELLYGIGMHKVVVSVITSIGKIGKSAYADPMCGVGSNCNAITVNDKDEADNMVGYLSSKLITYYIRRFKTASVSNSQSFFSWIPHIDLSKSFSDTELYDYFNLTNEEVNEIENEV